MKINGYPAFWVFCFLIQQLNPLQDFLALSPYLAPQCSDLKSCPSSPNLLQLNTSSSCPSQKALTIIIIENIAITVHLLWCWNLIDCKQNPRWQLHKAKYPNLSAPVVIQLLSTDSLDFG